MYSLSRHSNLGSCQFASEPNMGYGMLMQLDRYLREQRISSAEFARKIGCSKWAIKKYRTKVRIPRRGIMLKIKRATKGRVAEADHY